jgi:hypothetical protein
VHSAVDKLKTKTFQSSSSFFSSKEIRKEISLLLLKLQTHQQHPVVCALDVVPCYCNRGISPGSQALTTRAHRVKTQETTRAHRVKTQETTRAHRVKTQETTRTHRVKTQKTTRTIG